MASVVTQSCFDCKYTDCLVVCPVDCFHEGEQMLYIDPDYCTCCSACIPECPVGAIYSEDEVPADQKHFIALNAQMARICPPITQKKIPLAGSGVGSNFRSGTP